MTYRRDKIIMLFMRYSFINAYLTLSVNRHRVTPFKLKYRDEIMSHITNKMMLEIRQT